MLGSTVYQQREDASPTIGDRYAALPASSSWCKTTRRRRDSIDAQPRDLRLVHVLVDVLDCGVESLAADSRSRATGYREGGEEEEQIRRRRKRRRRRGATRHVRENTKHDGEDALRTPATRHTLLGIDVVVNDRQWP